MNEQTKTIRYNDDLTVEISYILIRESNYGADADGNRGMDMWFIDDYWHRVIDEKDNEVKLTDVNLIKDIEQFVEKESWKL